ncbi:16S rRNA (adenine(1518)-N(6)/adenine(1519)-N(6))-dimethyltransferase RsmA [Dongia deserti]|uniref:16S rRNA (adenine(1518)-N(6)/adenine(1519)-N(6))- dimethyltransferase RsmA n=1 Tax=Dongia deserti TaxID=2268030 RepID=UPI000E65377A|nr:16S rRNA (adenine(1518)-N(6)/adenine(1519)-N(6))-dimethyltransferase RsmA [Dongia deserti]
MAADGLPPLREVIAKYDLAARRALGQNFLLDLNLTGKIARAAGDLTTGTTIEIGPGPGGLTRALLSHGARELIAIERDTRCLGALAEIVTAYPGRLSVIEGDALAVDCTKLGTPPRRIVANLPYNIATPLIIKWLEQGPTFASLTVMVQKEVADRLVGRPRSKDYGRLSVLTQFLAKPRRLFDLPPRAFVPPPKVTSTVIEILPLPEPAFPARLSDLQRVTQAAFGQRRKMLRQSLRSLGADVEALVAQADVAPTARAEELSIAQFAALARALEKQRS